jgi:hypothetical protein
MPEDKATKRRRVIGTRVDDDLFDWIEALAKRNTRTLSHQTEHMLKIAQMVIERTDKVDDFAVIREKLAKYKFGGPNT